MAQYDDYKNDWQFMDGIVEVTLDGQASIKARRTSLSRSDISMTGQLGLDSHIVKFTLWDTIMAGKTPAADQLLTDEAGVNYTVRTVARSSLGHVWFVVCQERK